MDYLYLQGRKSRKTRDIGCECMTYYLTILASCNNSAISYRALLRSFVDYSSLHPHFHSSFAYSAPPKAPASAGRAPRQVARDGLADNKACYHRRFWLRQNQSERPGWCDLNFCTDLLLVWCRASDRYRLPFIRRTKSLY